VWHFFLLLWACHGLTLHIRTISQGVDGWILLLLLLLLLLQLYCYGNQLALGWGVVLD
jgi:hypothetical protein